MATSYPRATDDSKRIAQVGRRVPWRDVFRRLMKRRYPDIQLHDAPDPQPG